MKNTVLKKLSITTLLIGIFMTIVTYITFHYVTDYGFTLTKQEEAGKPFVTEMFGIFATIMLAVSLISFLYYIFSKDTNK